MTTEQVDEVVLIGGSSRIPCIRHRLEELFGAEKISEKIHPEEAVARGATMRAMTINSKNDVSLLFESGMPDLESLEALDGDSRRHCDFGLHSDGHRDSPIQ